MYNTKMRNILFRVKKIPSPVDFGYGGENYYWDMKSVSDKIKRS